MARPLRVNMRDGWYRAMSRGIGRRRIFAEAREHEHFLELLEEMVERFGVKVHAFVLKEHWRWGRRFVLETGESRTTAHGALRGIRVKILLSEVGGGNAATLR